MKNKSLKELLENLEEAAYRRGMGFKDADDQYDEVKQQLEVRLRLLQDVLEKAEERASMDNYEGWFFVLQLMSVVLNGPHEVSAADMGWAKKKIEELGL